MAEIEIGKFTLESLTTGMYNNPEIIYREYIQNAVDSFDNAVSQKIMQGKDCRIEIIVDSTRREISIKDNGTGIPKEIAEKTLFDIGNSTKKHTTNRGFRGIGRLGGLSYCKKLSFCTSAQNESEKTLVTFDCQKLKELLDERASVLNFHEQFYPLNNLMHWSHHLKLIKRPYLILRGRYKVVVVALLKNFCLLLQQRDLKNHHILYKNHIFLFLLVVCCIRLLHFLDVFE